MGFSGLVRAFLDLIEFGVLILLFGWSFWVVGI